MRILILAALAAFILPAIAQEPPPDGILVRAIVPVCDTEDKIAQVWQVHLDGDENSAIYVLRSLPDCRLLRGVYRVVRTIDTAWLKFSDRAYWSALTELVGADGNVYFGILVNSKVLPDKSA